MASLNPKFVLRNLFKNFNELPEDGQVLQYDYIDSNTETLKWADPASSSGSTILSSVRSSEVADISITPASYTTPVAITSEFTLEVGNYHLSSSYYIDANGQPAPAGLTFKYTGTAVFSAPSLYFSATEDGSANPILSVGYIVSLDNNQNSPDSWPTGTVPLSFGMVQWNQVLIVSTAGTFTIKARISDNELVNTYLLKDGYTILTKL